MKLDLNIGLQEDLGTDEFGRCILKVTKLANMKDCFIILDHLEYKLSGEFVNCATHTFYGEMFYEILEELQMELEELLESSEYEKQNKDELEYNIAKLEEFININDVFDNDTQEYQVHACW